MIENLGKISHYRRMRLTAEIRNHVRIFEAQRKHLQRLHDEMGAKLDADDRVLLALDQVLREIDREVKPARVRSAARLRRPGSGASGSNGTAGTGGR